MAFKLTTLLATLDSSIAALDSASELLEVLQAINVTNSTKGHGKTQRKYYASVADLPAADSSLRGMVTVVSTSKVDSANGLYLCTGTSWTEIQDLDSTTPYTGIQGSNFGYVSGGTPPISNVIQKFPFASDANASDVGDLTVARQGPSGQSSALDGYTSGGYGSGNRNEIDKFSFASGGNASDVGDLSLARQHSVGQSSSENGYASGGGGASNVIDKFPFSSDANASDIGNLTNGKYYSAGQSSATDGYVSGGRGTGPTGTVYYSTIDKFPFSTDTNATNIGDLTELRVIASGQSSSSHGYVSGGEKGATTPGATITNSIEKFSFATGTDAADISDLIRANQSASGQSSTTNGYVSGGNDPLPGLSNTIQKFPFASDTNATDVGDLLTGGRYAAGQQY